MKQVLVAVLVICSLVVLAQAKKIDINIEEPASIPPTSGGVWSAVNGTNGWSVVPGWVDDAFAWATYRDNVNVTGWGIFNVTTNPQHGNSHTAYAAGYLEGFLMPNDIYNAILAFIVPYYNSTTISSADLEAGIPFPASVTEFVQNNTNWVQDKAKKKSKNYPENVGDDDEAVYWTHIDLVLKQLDGITDGYNAVAEQPLPYWTFIAWQLQDELGDIYSTLQVSDFFPVPAAAKTLQEKLITRDHCSVLVKVPANNTALFASHVTWSDYASMLRTYKHYNFSFTGVPNVPQISLSSEPGFIPSGDDFFITSANLVVMETTNDIWNQSLYYDYTTIKTVPYWIRVMVANRLATSGAEWTGNFTKYNSGTYNNQWIVVDYKLFTPGQPLQPGTLWIAEQIPGFVVAEDQTPFLIQNGHWPSYNIPFYPFIYNISGYPAMYQQYGNSMNYTMCPRAQIFARDQGKVQNFTDFVNLMRSNNWQTDPLSLGTPCNAISARCDLDTTQPGQAFGGMDCKATDNTQSYLLQAQAISGPTTETQPPFTWTPEFASTPHYGQPTTFNFEFQTMSPAN